jgi:hypothetical protein
MKFFLILLRIFAGDFRVFSGERMGRPAGVAKDPLD